MNEKVERKKKLGIHMLRTHEIHFRPQAGTRKMMCALNYLDE
jgi:hypothetical protein